MYINITDSETGNNKGSSAALVEYLEKENRMEVPDRLKQAKLWFTTSLKEVIHQQVRIDIDNNIAKLGKNDAKFFLINISPSENEIAYLKKHFGESGAQQKLKEFACGVMDAYAQNFKRSNIRDNGDLLWYGKLEHYRYYAHNDPEVFQGLAKTGEHKAGENMHVQIIVSRKDITNKIKLSPMNNSKGNNKAHSAKLGQFDRVAFKEVSEQLFDKMFGFERPLKETLSYAMTMKNGTAEQKQSMYLLEQLEKQSSSLNKMGLLDLANNIYRNESQSNPFDNLVNLTGELFDFLSPTELSFEQQDEFIPDPKKKKKKRKPGF
ncbi:MAG: DUF5712 family protein [Flavobacterium nitrogenifigens]|uniref:DUF5712 family protein n=1 Tax=Flavobacterium nitrogenifigens TaxID=1617283 RepID=UPI0028094B98|nr:DUF5712 family protein [Flavobacterium nitrogenifigens]MDQ8015086.1 DUF5712 family protein [Flavobacterium nitrogenifigens]